MAVATLTTAHPVAPSQVAMLEARPPAAALAAQPVTRGAAREAASVLADRPTGIEHYRGVSDGLSSVAATRSVGTRVTEAEIMAIFEQAGLGQGRSIHRGLGGR